MLKKILKTLGAILVIAIAGILIYAKGQPDMLKVERSVIIAAPAAKIFPLINDLHSWNDWSPFEHRDPNMRRTFSGSAKGEGAAYEWNGNSEVGSGRMEIVKSMSPSQIVIKLDFISPFEGHDTAEFHLDSQGNSTKVTWSMFGPQSYVGKVMCVFMDMDSMIGKDFNEGLGKLKSIAEKH